METHDPAHPGEIVREKCLNPLGLTVTAAAKVLGVTCKALSDLLNGQTGVSPDMAIRLEQVFGSTADTWLRLQMQRDLWEARQRSDKIKVTRRFTPVGIALRLQWLNAVVRSLSGPGQFMLWEIAR
jgi:addiction module HigA family antidote